MGAPLTGPPLDTTDGSLNKYLIEIYMFKSPPAS